MGGHYFDENPEKESKERLITNNLRGREMTFISDQGVFSKNNIDYGSRLLIESFQWPDVQGDIADIGCGYGPIGLTLAKETENTVWLADVNKRALALAEKNAAQLGLHHTKVIESDLFEALVGRTFAVVVSNPPIRAGKATVHRLFEEAFEHLCHNGELWIVIQKKQGAPSALEKLKTLFGRVDTVEKKKGYYIYRATKC
ncbi:class I SAM-dependent methyltransferase [Alteribacillus iranensis]|uniref:16S rRNA m(2)G 1207 methyltransferase n=1 Tax=Alteribacillus iranensis TaxID=930128 RepID=A0A1I2F630_9BACI|nr:class I SAM-dependent methyltransferase [Alteribacillus iranensis]SFF00904.1 16S rRNA m(2)G 1207 methyltransferase [Alteribacillus iranensis]